MARNASRSGRTLIAFVLVVLAMYGGLALNGEWVPKLGLDLQGGTRITLEASTSTGEAITPEKLDEAAAIIDNRVNAYGVAESEVSTQGSNNIVVEIPGEERKEIVDAVKQTAQLRFRLVAGAAPGTPAAQEPPADVQPGDGGQDSGNSNNSNNSNNSMGSLDGSDRAARPSRSGSTDQPAPDQPAPDQPAPDQPAGGGPGSQAPQPATVPTDESSIEEILAWTRNPNAAWLNRFADFTCENADEQRDNPARPLLACDENDTKYLLSPAVIEGTQLTDANFGIPQNDVQYAVTLSFNGAATDRFADVTRAIVGTNEQFAIVLDKEVLSAPVVTAAITNGNPQITGDFTAAEAESLANSLRYGALPLTFEAPVVSEEGPRLAAGQLQAGLIAGGIGLGIVLVYCMLYYRGLGVVVVASLVAFALLIYAVILFLSENAGFTLTLPGIAGLIVGVGITADSFIVFFERIRDEMREGKSVRVAVESGWDRAKMTCVIADAVSLLAAAVLFTFAIGVVKGFAFALGMSTVIDLVVFFWLTKPMVTWLARFTFFSSGHRLSGLSAEQAGIDRIGVPRAAAAGGMVR